jgi:hypothetical protein
VDGEPEVDDGRLEHPGDDTDDDDGEADQREEEPSHAAAGRGREGLVVVLFDRGHTSPRFSITLSEIHPGSITSQYVMSR